jgi:hypothetical protein
MQKNKSHLISLFFKWISSVPQIISSGDINNYRTDSYHFHSPKNQEMETNFFKIAPKLSEFLYKKI